eukprot:Rmarinus@m.17851
MSALHRLLGVSPGATRGEIKAAYREKAKQYHPDVNPSKESAVRFQEITKAYRHLVDALDAAERFPDSRLDVRSVRFTCEPQRSRFTNTQVAFFFLFLSSVYSVLSWRRYSYVRERGKAGDFPFAPHAQHAIRHPQYDGYFVDLEANPEADGNPAVSR